MEPRNQATERIVHERKHSMAELQKKAVLKLLFCCWERDKDHSSFAEGGGLVVSPWSFRWQCLLGGCHEAFRSCRLLEEVRH